MLKLLLATVLGLVPSLSQELATWKGGEKMSVAGDNPFFYCSDPDPYTLQIAYINISPPDPADCTPYVDPVPSCVFWLFSYLCSFLRP